MRQLDEPRGEEFSKPSALSKAQREAVLEEMNSIVSDPAFSRSQRSVALLRGVIEHAVNGDEISLKERTLGVEVFGRDSNYDSNADPVVRVTANDIRKRLAQFYQNSDRLHKVRVRLVPGSYVPEFQFSPAEPVENPAPEVPETAAPLDTSFHQQPSAAAPPGVIPALGRHRLWIMGLLAVLLAAAVGLALSHSKWFRGSQELVWRPLIQSPEELTICVGDNSALQQRGKDQLTPEETRAKLQRFADMIRSRRAPALPSPDAFDSTTPFVDARVAHNITSFLAHRSQPTLLRPSSALTLQDFRDRPAVLVGGFDNPWSIILLSGMRFSLKVDPNTGTFSITDAQNPAMHAWERHLLVEAQPAVDYAVVTRFFDTETDNWILAIAGLGPHGTEAAGQLILDPSFAHSIPASIRSAQNFQLVIGTKVINGNTGPPEVLAVHTW